jgi:hypothetical protein
LILQVQAANKQIVAGQEYKGKRWRLFRLATWPTKKNFLLEIERAKIAFHMPLILIKAKIITTLIIAYQISSRLITSSGRFMSFLSHHVIHIFFEKKFSEEKNFLRNVENEIFSIKNRTTSFYCLIATCLLIIHWLEGRI